jgi:hypothetical protein
MKIDPQDPSSHGKPLWVVYGLTCFPSLLCAKLLAYGADYQPRPVGVAGAHVCLWGYSVYRGEPGFRTRGVRVEEWAKRSTMKPRWFDTQTEALECLRKLTTPRAEVTRD